MIDFTEITLAAAREYPLSLRDDPTAWNPAPATWLEIQDTCNAVIRENARSAFGRLFVRQQDAILSALLVAAHDDGPLADLPAVWREHVAGLDVDLSPVLETGDWQEQQEALRHAVAVALDRHAYPDCGSTLAAYVANEPRLSAFHGGRPAPTISPVVDWDDAEDADDYTPPPHIAKAWQKPLGEADAPRKRTRRTKAQMQADAKSAAMSCGPARALSLPKLPGLLHVAGFTDDDVGRIFGVSRAYWNMVRSGKRNFNGVKPSELTALRAEIEGRIAALQEVAASLSDKAVVSPSGV